MECRTHNSQNRLLLVFGTIQNTQMEHMLCNDNQSEIKTQADERRKKRTGMAFSIIDAFNW